MIRLGDLFPEVCLPARAGEIAVLGLTADSRQVRQGFVFVAIPGARTHGRSFLPQAVAAGAVAIAGEGEGPAGLPAGIPFLAVANARAALARAASIMHPHQPATVAAITGTSGKTSVAAFTRQIWQTLGHSAAALGTTGVVGPAGTLYGSLTTPDPVTLHRTLDDLAAQGVTHLAMEASSHGLDQRRLDGVRLSAGAFTNLSRDHLDYHRTLDDYLSAKLRLFDTLLHPGMPAVVDADSEVARQVIGVCQRAGLATFTIGREGTGLRVVSALPGPSSTRLVVEFDEGSREIEIPLAGGFMASNALVAAGLAIVTGGDPQAVLGALEGLSGAPGRLEKIGERNGAPVFVDYAHKPDALEKVLQTLRRLAVGRLIVVFGCGGDRDTGKRPLMGAIAARHADLVIVTDDNPRSEDPAAIRRAILKAAPGARETGDRGLAISQAVAELRPGDVLVIAGKGHETGQIVGDAVLPFSDQEAVRAALKENAA